MRSNLAAEFTALRRPAVLLVLVSVVLGATGLFAFYTFVTPIMVDLVGFSTAAMPFLLAVFGLGMTVGAITGGWLADRFDPRRVLVGLLAVQAVLLIVAVFAVRSPIVAPLLIFGVGALGLSFLPSVQSVVMGVAGNAPALASASIQSAFNIANALGAALGGLALAAGLGLASPPGVGAVLSVVGLVPAVSLVVLARRTQLRATPGPRLTGRRGGMLPGAPPLFRACRWRSSRDVVCPWCYIGKRRFEAALADFADADDVTVTYRSFQLDPDAPPRSTESVEQHLAAKYGRTLEQAREMNQGVTDLAAGVGLDFHLDKAQRANTFDAHRMLHFAAARGKQAELAERLLDAYFTQGALVSDHTELTEQAVAVGLDRAEGRGRACGRRLRRAGAGGLRAGASLRRHRGAVLRVRPEVRRVGRAGVRCVRRRAQPGLERHRAAGHLSPGPWLSPGASR